MTAPMHGPVIAPVLELDRLAVRAAIDGETRTLVHDCTIRVAPGEAVGLVGESGSGKTLSARAVAGLLPEGFSTGGAIRIEGEDLAALSPSRLRDLRARRIGMVFQSPRAHLNPLRTIGDFMTEALVSVAGAKPDAAAARAADLLAEVGIPDPARLLRQRPGELSGGLLQRVMIASTLAMDPRILLADEITTALDVTTQEEVMAVIADLRRHRDLAMLFITHDLALAGAVCDRVAVMQHGRVIETLRASTMRSDASEPYTKRLMAAALPEEERGAGANATTGPAAPVLAVEDLRKVFAVRSERGFGTDRFTAVDGVGFELRAGSALGIVGESGSGKSTTARIVCGLETADAGTVAVMGDDWSRPARGAAERRRRARVAQMVFQDPYQSLDRRRTVGQTLAEAIGVHRPGLRRAELRDRVEALLGAVRLDVALAERRPRALSGGQLQRVAIARALAAEPEILVLDEAVSALDVTTQVEILTLLDGIRRETGVALLMISHDLETVRRLCDRVVVMRAGVVVEQGAIAEVLDRPQAEYTRTLLDSIPREGWVPRRRLTARTTPLPTVATAATRTIRQGDLHE
ncbi:ABC transporter ATP-binding protein [Agromyces luteolus]|uniref:Nickel ABC transporter ATP-binding protein NikE n=1 Tax=Agromyces luteolus TaxID=88373 RepID=A0A7C9HIU6_9MICO|nr:ABC transporter ATP-binding protein [Agromyces luteolus]MUN06144.1 nickel ABC transporter ATP-binding protein NikE [Agromyces luteolus]GLK28815.1 ABC transporter ATP-binding protein [Agromyces luteolus]